MTDATTAATDTTAAATTTAAIDTTAATIAAATTQAATTDASAAAAATTTAADTTATTTTAADWRSGITDPDHIEFAKRMASPADAIKSAVDLRKLNSSMIRVPGKDATAEDKAKFNKAIGVPDTAEGYKFDIGREPSEQDKVIQGNLAKIAFDNGIPANAMTALSKAVTELATAQKAEENRVAVEARAANEAALRKEWGADYERNKTLATRAVQAFGEVKSHPEVIEFFDNTMVNGQKLGDHPVMVRLLGNIGNRMGEGEFIGAVGTDQRQSLQSELSGILAANPPGTPGYAKPDIQKRVLELNEALHGTGGVVGVGGRAV